MQLVITSTDRQTVVNGQPCRVWSGVAENGARCVVFVPAIAVAPGQDPTLFDAALAELPPPAESFPLHRIAPAFARHQESR